MSFDRLLVNATWMAPKLWMIDVVSILLILFWSWVFSGPINVALASMGGTKAAKCDPRKESPVNNTKQIFFFFLSFFLFFPIVESENEQWWNSSEWIERVKRVSPSSRPLSGYTAVSGFHGHHGYHGYDQVTGDWCSEWTSLPQLPIQWTPKQCPAHRMIFNGFYDVYWQVSTVSDDVQSCSVSTFDS